MQIPTFLTASLSLILAIDLAPAHAADTHVAVATNFANVAGELAAAFNTATGHNAILSFGATGQIYAQIIQGAPFEVFLAADEARPALVIKTGHGVAGSVFTYAVGQLVLYSSDAARVKGADTLKADDFERLAIANPATAPYGVAAVQTLRALGLYQQLQPRIVQGQNIGQTYQFVQTGNAQLGLVALGQVARSQEGSRWVVPQAFYAPIKQDAVLLQQGENNPAAKAFLAFLQSDRASGIIHSYGYAISQ